MAITRYNLNTYDSGEEYKTRLSLESDRNFKVLLSLLSSYWQSNIDGPNYARELKAIAIELSRLRLALNDVHQDISILNTRTEFLYQTLTSMMFPDDVPDLENSSEEFKLFLVRLINCYFKGSIPSSLENAISLVTEQKVVIVENYDRNDEVGNDISNQFGFDINIVLDDPNQLNTMLSDRNIKIILSLLKPAHTLYRIKNIFSDKYDGKNQTENPFTNTSTNKVIDSSHFELNEYQYETLKKSIYGLKGVDDYGVKQIINVIEEDHTFKIESIPNLIGYYDSSTVADGSSNRITSWSPTSSLLPSLVANEVDDSPYKNGSLWADGVGTVNFSSSTEWLVQSEGLARAFEPNSSWTIIVIGEYAGDGPVIWSDDGLGNISSFNWGGGLLPPQIISCGSNPSITTTISPIDPLTCSGPCLTAWLINDPDNAGNSAFAVYRSGDYSGWKSGNNPPFTIGSDYIKHFGGLGVGGLSLSGGFAGRIRAILIFSRKITEQELSSIAENYDIT